MDHPAPTPPDAYHDALDAITPAAVLKALALVREGRIFSLESGWWRGMPVHPVHPQFEVLTYRTPRGMRNQGDQAYMNPPANTVGFGFVSELLISTAHCGSHIDAISHVTSGERDEWADGRSADHELGDFGPLSYDASHLRAIVARGVLLDIPALLKREHCERGFHIDAELLRAAAVRQSVDVRPGDVVLVRTGQMRFWPDTGAMSAAIGSGVSLDGARWLADQGVVAVGADTVQFECTPTGVEGDPLPVHVHLMKDRKIPILEWINLEELAAAGCSEFLFVCLPLPIAGATGSMVRPIAIA